MLHDLSALQAGVDPATLALLRCALPALPVLLLGALGGELADVVRLAAVTAAAL